MSTPKYYTQRKFDTTVHIFEFTPGAIKCMPTMGDTSKKQKLTQIKHAWFESNNYTKIAAINLAFFDSKVSKPYGLNYTDGGFLHSSSWAGDDFLELIFDNNKLYIEDIDGVSFKAKYPKATWGSSLSYSLITGGKINLQKREKFYFGKDGQRHPRTLIGQKADGTIVLAVSDGRVAKEKGLTAQESAQTMLDLGCVIAINADGGGSSEMMVENKIMNRLSDGSERPLANALLVYAPKGTKVEYGESKPTPVPTPKPTTPIVPPIIKAQVIATVLNIREQPSTSAKIVGKYPLNEIIDVISTKGEWAQTRLGWVYGDYIKPYSIPTPNDGTYKYIVDHIPKSQNRRPGSKFGKYNFNYQGITIHNTGNKNSTAANERGWLTNPNNDRTASWHLVVDDKNVIEAIPINEIAWHAGDFKGNNTTIGIEICEPQHEKAMKNAIHLCADLLKQKGWGVDRLYTHQMWSGKNCPNVILRLGLWNQFVAEVKKLL